MKRITADVLVPAYNEEGIIGKTINSIAKQTNLDDAHFSVHIVTNGCTDHTLQEAKRAIAALETQTHMDFTVHSLDISSKIHALNFGLRQTSAPIVIAVDADTVLSPNCFSATLKLFQDPEAMVGGPLPQALVSKKNCDKIVGKMQKTVNICNRLYECIRPVGCMIAWRRELFDEYPTTIAGDDSWISYTAATKYGWQSVRLAKDATAWIVAPKQWIDYIKQESRFQRIDRQLLEVFPEFKRVFLMQRTAIRSAAAKYRETIKAEFKKQRIHLNYWEHHAFIQKICAENAELMSGELLGADNRWETILTTKKTPEELC
jgi:cellulose synthase/poly-beta-1,6-N-acetylglucosamine synthase-like glycosyltransferase